VPAEQRQVRRGVVVVQEYAHHAGRLDIVTELVTT
jgi:hypothetical protein